MARLLPVKYILRQPCYIYIFLTTSSVLFVMHLKYQQISKEMPGKLGVSYASFQLDLGTGQSIANYFERKSQLMKRSPFKTVLPREFQRASNKTLFLIYAYTKHRQFCRKYNSESFCLSTCPFRNCQFTCDTSLIRRADAIIMFYSHLNYDKLFDLAVYRNPNQLWLLWHDEPYATAPVYNKFLFNWTMSYRLDSEVSVATYGVTHVRNESINQIVFAKWIDENYKNRHNEAVWFVSNCNSQKRLHFYGQLKQHFPISAFGKCINNQTNDSHKCVRGSQCELEKLSTSKFYLAFESTTLRRDYITEKFWRSLSLGAIPIVLGPKRQSYERIAPPNSFIYAQDYSDFITLAKHLNDVATNRQKYEKYHAWKINYETRYLSRDVEPIRFCELCYRLNKNKDRIWYSNVNKYFLEID
ncbi:unnamed protein product [Rotaria magnacalcarata]|uniref:Fucosyltransferase n=3 Tax=Rotaria magnacalcarata TaxID=392030 RepID=A0A814TZ70_9BILA|nr:unnamed protein product [Rotaria magnacalcarata]CAF1386291.1 unnamed protein product [Rotaria magnacalcarata]CAF4024753.1 unnamed protein product [Rotaria magnacalcarata]CAF4061552.1 unnamed protein product [Rotaria magnacalcarata]